MEQDNSRTKLSILIASSFSSFLSTIITNPIQVAKLNRQYLITACPQYPHPSYKSFHLCDCSKFNINNSFNGLKVALPQVLISNICYMQLYEYQRNMFLKSSISSTVATLISSIISRVIVSTAMLPLQVHRVRMSNLQKFNQNNFNRGLKATLTRDIIFSGLFWTSLQSCRNLLIGDEYRLTTKEQQNELKLLSVNFLSGFMVGIIVSGITTPLDTVKTRIQSDNIKKKNYSIIKQLRKIYRKQGWKGLFSGVEYRIMKNSLHSCIYLMLYEWSLNKARGSIYQ